MEPFGILDEYFIKPINERTGYNPVNTVTYAIIALAAAYVIFRFLKRENVRVSERFVLSLFPYILFGSTLRVVVDAGFLPYTYITTTPGIYVLVGIITLSSLILFKRMGRMRWFPILGAVLLVPFIILLLPLLSHHSFAILVLLLAMLGFLLGEGMFEASGIRKRNIHSVIVFSHALDGAATFVTIDIFAKSTGLMYFEQHVLSSAIAGYFGGFWAFYILKVLFAIGAVYLLRTSKDLKKDEENYLVLLLIIFGLAPGVRNFLRMWCGV